MKIRREYRIELSVWPENLAVNLTLPPRSEMAGWRFSIMLRHRPGPTRKFIHIAPDNIYAIGPFVVWRLVNSQYTYCPKCSAPESFQCSKCKTDIEIWKLAHNYQ